MSIKEQTVTYDLSKKPVKDVNGTFLTLHTRSHEIMKKKKKFDIFRTFDIFSSEAISIIKERVIKFILVEADNFFITKSFLHADINKNDEIQISVFNNKNVYNLLTTAWRKHQQREENETVKL